MIALEEKERLLLRLLSGDEPFEESCMKTLLPCPSIDDEKIEYLLMLSILGIRKRWQFFPKAVLPRLQGIYRYFRVQNVERVTWLRKIMRRLEDNGIPVLFLKGIAMRTYYETDAPRQMSDFDIAVPEQFFEEAKKIFLEAGCADTSEGAALHAVTLYNDDFSVDLHRWIFKTHGEKGTDLWERALTVSFYGSPVRILQPVDMIIHILDSRARDAVRVNQEERRMKWLFDTRRIMEQSGCEDWGEIARRAEKLRALPYLKMILPVFSEIFPEKLGAEELKHFFPKDRDYDRWFQKAERFRKETEGFLDAVSLCGDNIYTPYMALRELRHLWTGWRSCFGPELRAAGDRMNFIRYVCYSLKADSPAQLFRKYLPVLKKGRENG